MSHGPITVFVAADGLLRFVYDDELAALLSLGANEITRASHVEPTPIGWTADMGPSGGELLGPFGLRGDALNAEHQWLTNRLSRTLTPAT
jgi:hypothetical protein